MNEYNSTSWVIDVFTPTKPARATFVEREHLNDRLVNALLTPGKQIVVYGYSGSGKTTLLTNKLHQIYENHITTRCYDGLTFDQLLLDAFDQLDLFYESEKTSAKKNEMSTGIESQYAGVKTLIGLKVNKESQSKRQRMIPPQLTPQALARFLGNAGCCWVLEDFHKIAESEKLKLAQIMKLFMDMSDQYSTLKIICIGAVDTARQVIAYDPELRSRVSEIYIPLMNREELNEIIAIGEKLLNFSIPSGLKDNIVKYSNGLGSVCHQICLNICFAAGIDKSLANPIQIDNSILGRAVELYLENTSDTLKATFDKAFRRYRNGKYNNCRLILEALLKCHQDGATYSEIHEIILRKTTDYPRGNLTFYLKQLLTEERGGIVRYDSLSGVYSFADPIYRAFAIALFESERRKQLQTEVENKNALMDIVRELFGLNPLYFKALK